MSVPGTENDINNNDDDHNIIFSIKDIKLYVPVVTLSGRDNFYQNFLAEDLKDQFIGMNIKQKVRIKIQQMNIDIFSNQILLELIDCLFLFIQIMKTMLKDLILENNIYQNI